MGAVTNKNNDRVEGDEGRKGRGEGRRRKASSTKRL